MAVNQQEAEKTERKLRPLYDAVDNGHNKKAVQIADKILKKQDDLQCARALKAIALLRMGRQDEAVSAMNSVLSSHPGDQATLQACTTYFKENSEYLKIAEMYADASSHYPKNQEILTHLFMAYVRLGDYQKQQHTAIQLHQAFPESGPYYCWRVMSILMQAADSKNNGKANQLYLPLAEKLIDKYFAEKDVDSEAEVRLYLMVLDKQGKTEKKLRVLDGTPGSKLKNREEFSSLQVECLVALKQWERVATVLAELINDSPDQWSYIRQYIACQVRRCLDRRCEELKVANGVREEVEEEGSKEREGLDGGADKVEWSWNTLDGSEECLQPLRDARDLMESLASEEVRVHLCGDRTRYIVRGPLLGRMELLLQLQSTGMHKIPLHLVSCQDMLMDYFTLFGSKKCVMDDLCQFVEVFDRADPEGVRGFLQQVQHLLDSEPIDFNCSDEDIKQNVYQLHRHMNLLQLQSFLNCLPLGKKELLELCLSYHKQAQRLTLDPEAPGSQPCEFYAILASHLLLDEYQITSDIKLLWEAIFLLERAKSSNSQICLLLMKIYGMLGGIESITELFKEIAIKHLQLETIGYIPMRYIQSMGTFGFAGQMYKSSLRFYYSASKDFSEYIIQAYRNGAFNKIEEFVECRDRLTHSFNFINTLTEMNVLDMILSVHSISQAREFFKKDWIPKLPCSLKDYVSNLIDNRDFSVFEDWSPSSRKLTDAQFRVSFELECLWLRARLSLVMCLGVAVSLTSREHASRDDSSPEGGVAASEATVLARKVEEYRSTLEQMDQHVGMAYLREVMKQGSQTRLPLQHPPPCLGFFFLRKGYGQLIFNMFRVTMKVKEGDGNIGDHLRDVLSSLEAVRCQLRGVPDELRLSLSEITDLRSAEEEEEEGGEKAAPRSEHPYDIITRVQLDLEPYVMLLQSMSIVLLLCVVCAEILVPSTESKKKKKKRASSKNNMSPVCSLLRDFVAELQRMLSSLCRVFHPLPLPDADEEKLLLQLKNLYLTANVTAAADSGISEEGIAIASVASDGERSCGDATSLAVNHLGSVEGDRGESALSVKSDLCREMEMKTRVCGTVLTSYDMSLRDTMQTAQAKLRLANSLVEQLGGRAKGQKEVENSTE